MESEGIMEKYKNGIKSTDGNKRNSGRKRSSNFHPETKESGLDKRGGTDKSLFREKRSKEFQEYGKSSGEKERLVKAAAGKQAGGKVKKYKYEDKRGEDIRDRKKTNGDRARRGMNQTKSTGARWEMDKAQSNGAKRGVDKAISTGDKQSLNKKDTSGFNPELNKEEAFGNLCPYAKKCGGCEYQGMEYEKQLKEKQKLIQKHMGNFCRVLPIIGMEHPYHYRNKVHAAFDISNGSGGIKKGAVISGVYKAGTHEVVPIDSCLIEDETADAVIRDIRGLLRSFKIKTYDEDTGYGLLRHVLVRRGFQSGEVMVVLVLGSPILPSKNNFVKALRELHPEISTIIINVNSKRTSMVLGDKESVIYGKGYIEDTLCGRTFRISPKSFYQVNPVQTEVLYRKAIAYAGLTGKETVVDAYCGIGTIGLIAASGAKEVISVELNRDAVRDAVINAKRNGIKNVQFYQADAGKFMVEMADQGAKADVVFMDPPRSGSDEAFLSAVVRLKPDKVVYVSCNPETLGADVGYLVRKGYEAVECQGVDMFPWTGHVETVVLLSKLKSAKSIEVKIELDEMDLTSAESKATYEEIKQYVFDNTGLKVSQLYVAQVKRKHGLIERINYNVGNGKSKVPQVPAEKEKAIEDALKHFKMLS